MSETRRVQAEAIFRAGVDAVRADEAVRRSVRCEGGRLVIGDDRYILDDFRNITVVGAGKATASMADAVEELVGEDRIAGGYISVKYGHGAPLARIAVGEAGHPIPDSAGVENTRKILALLEEMGENDLVFCLLSGGGSALLPAPAEGITLTDKQEITRLLIGCGAPIEDVNAVRKHLSMIKGGNLARAAAPARVVSLILSDVVGDDLGTIASGPTSPDPTTFRECEKILMRYSLTEIVPGSIRERIAGGIAGKIPETPKPGDPIFKGVTNLIVGSNRIALEAAREKARELGMHPVILSSEVIGDVGDFASEVRRRIEEVQAKGIPAAPPACLLWGGETTVKIQGAGRGGRNQEMALRVALGISGKKGVIFLSGGTDGSDGPTDAAGAWVTGETVERAKSKELQPIEFLHRNDSYAFFSRVGGHVFTGPTGTNVMDLYLALIEG